MFFQSYDVKCTATFFSGHSVYIVTEHLQTKLVTPLLGHALAYLFTYLTKTKLWCNSDELAAALTQGHAHHILTFDLDLDLQLWTKVTHQSVRKAVETHGRTEPIALPAVLAGSVNSLLISKK